MDANKIYNEDCLLGLSKLPDNCIDCCVTSPPYFGLRDYGHQDQVGREKSPDEFVAKLVEVFEQVRRVLKPEGTLWLNLGDSYNGSGGQGTKPNIISDEGNKARGGKAIKISNLKPKDLIGIPWAAAFALRSAGWYLRQDIIWNKPNPMPESVTDRCTKAHEYIFLFSKSNKYFYDSEAIKVPYKDASFPRLLRGVSGTHKNVNGAPGQTPHGMGKPRKNYRKEEAGSGKTYVGHKGYFRADGTLIGNGMANKKSVWTVTTKPFKGAHFATFPQDLITDCIKAGCPEGGLVLDPFMGAGTTALVALQLNRKFVGYELNPEYIKIADERLKDELMLL